MANYLSKVIISDNSKLFIIESKGKIYGTKSKTNMFSRVLESQIYSSYIANSHQQNIKIKIWMPLDLYSKCRVDSIQIS
ncbi:unnamed protein product [Blepharisma stoltei]|uniref:Uncharacterized protein n=1 Tax=Blepharisma stoltei TaxID=1481888 RepID=A0AAU9JEI9_9CILI|nr:unnamed protein product [Blepharisma stoltei]